jgi:tRNA threonylcarbamoyladenosine biosynthesis protein TsaE
MIITTESEGEMKKFGARLGALLNGGEIIELVGDVGAGKTTLAKGIAMGMGVDEDVQSPSFTISRVYTTGSNLALAHYDFYRLNEAGIMMSELHETVQDPRTVTMIEWAEIVNGVLPEDRLTIQITSPTETSREIVLLAGGEKSNQLVKALA